MTLTTQQILQGVRKKLLEETNEILSDADLLLNVNLAYDDLRYSSFTNDQIQSATVNFTNGVGSLPSDFGTAYGKAFKSNTDRTSYTEQSIEQFENREQDFAFTIKGGQIYVLPTTTASFLLNYFPSYAELTLVQNPEIHPFLHELIMYGAMYRVYEDLQNEAMSEYYRNKYQQEFELKTAKLSNYQEDNMGGNSMFTYQRLV